VESTVKNKSRQLIIVSVSLFLALSVVATTVVLLKIYNKEDNASSLHGTSADNANTNTGPPNIFSTSKHPRTNIEEKTLYYLINEQEDLDSRLTQLEQSQASSSNTTQSDSVVPVLQELEYTERAVEAYEKTILTEGVDIIKTEHDSKYITQGLIVNELNGIEMMNISCGYSLCKASFKSSSFKQKEHFSLKIPSIMPENSGGFVHDVGDGGTFTVYYARGNNRLPKVE
jgi:hypothetical protein